METRVGLDEILAEAELSHYTGLMETRLKLAHAEHLREVRDEDLADIGMAKPEIRRLWKVFHKRCPRGLVGKLKRRVLGRMNSACESKAASRAASRAPSVEADAQQHIIRAEDILLCKKLGEGEFGTVWQGVWTSGGAKASVAVKCVSAEKMQANPMDFLGEAAIMHKISHPSIVRLHGVVLELKSIMLVGELAPLRSLLECLREPNLLPSFPVLRLCDFATQIAEGLAYLEEQRLVHRDVAARNILVFSADKVKISDFGLSRALGVGEEYYRSQLTTNLRLPIAWCAPECIKFLRFTSASDVWAFGVTLWELFSYGLQPWAGLSGQAIMATVDGPRGERLEMPDACPREMYTSLLTACWAHEPDQRPSFRQILALLPEVTPEQVRAIAECADGVPDHLQHGAGQVITVLDKRPPAYPDGYYWKGVAEGGRSGLFQPANTVAYLAADYPASRPHIALHGQNQIRMGRGCEEDPSQVPPLSRGASARSSKGKGRGLSRAMISGPVGDVAHVGHIHCDGSSFGAVPQDAPKRAAAVRPRVAEASPVSLRRHDNRLESTASETASLIHRSSLHEAADPFDEEETPPTQFDNPLWGAGTSLLDEVFSALDKGDFSTPSTFRCESEEGTPVAEEAPPEPKSRKPEAVVRPVTFLDAKLLSDVSEMAHKLNEKALSKVEAKSRAREEARNRAEMAELQLALSISRNHDSSDSGPSSKEENGTGPVPLARREKEGISLKKKLAKTLKLNRSHSTESSGSCDSQKKCFSDQLPPKTDLLAARGWSPSAEDAYKSLISSGRSLSRLAHSDPEDPLPPEEESPNPLRLLRAEGGSVARSFKPARPARPQLSGYEHCADGAATATAATAAVTAVTSTPPPPVPPKPARAKASPSLPRAPPTLPKPSPAVRAVALAGVPRAVDRRLDPALDFAMEDVDKYHLLDFVMAAFETPPPGDVTPPRAPPRLKSKSPTVLDYAHLRFQEGARSPPGFAGSEALAAGETEPIPL